jgi:hypothetical protein
MSEDEAKEILRNRSRYECGGIVRDCGRCISTCKGDDPRLAEAEAVAKAAAERWLRGEQTEGAGVKHG